jgi:hypothetical protein
MSDNFKTDELYFSGVGGQIPSASVLYNQIANMLSLINVFNKLESIYCHGCESPFFDMGDHIQDLSNKLKALKLVVSFMEPARKDTIAVVLEASQSFWLVEGTLAYQCFLIRKRTYMKDVYNMLKEIENIWDRDATIKSEYPGYEDVKTLLGNTLGENR